MKFLMMMFFCQVSVAQVLLIPDQTVNFLSYKTNCAKEGYLCTTKFQLDQVQAADTPLFNEFINQLDYSSESFKAEFIPKFFSILKDESLSLDQIEMMQKVIEQLKEFSEPQKKKQLSFLEQQLTEISQLVKHHQLTDLPERYLIVLKTAVPLDFLKQLKPPAFKVKTFVVTYNRALDSDAAAVEGLCEAAKVHPSLQNKKWQIDSEKTCGFTEHFVKAKNSTTHFFKENQNTLIAAGLIVVGASILMNNYEVKLTF